MYKVIHILLSNLVKTSCHNDSIFWKCLSTQYEEKSMSCSNTVEEVWCVDMWGMAERPPHQRSLSCASWRWSRSPAPILQIKMHIMPYVHSWQCSIALVPCDKQLHTYNSLLITGPTLRKGLLEDGKLKSNLGSPIIATGTFIQDYTTSMIAMPAVWLLICLSKTSLLSCHRWQEGM